MKKSTLVELTIITDDRFLGNCANIKTKHSITLSSLKTAIFGEGLEFWQVGNEKVLNCWEGEEKGVQIRQYITLMLTKSLSKNKIYDIINQVQSQPLKFINR